MPNFLFDLPIGEHAKLILIYLCRRADRKGFSFPSLDRMGRDCGIGSHNTVGKAIKELESKDLIIKESGGVGRSNRYRLAPRILIEVGIVRLNEHAEPVPVASNTPSHHVTTTMSLHDSVPSAVSNN